MIGMSIWLVLCLPKTTHGNRPLRTHPFFLNYGMHPLTPVSVGQPRTVPKAHDFVQGIEQAVRRAKQELRAMQDRMIARANAHRRDVLYSPGDRVLLSTRNLNIPGPGLRKLKPTYMGPYPVEYMVGKVAVKLRLPPDWSRIHDVHVSLVKPWVEPSGPIPEDL